MHIHWTAYHNVIGITIPEGTGRRSWRQEIYCFIRHEINVRHFRPTQISQGFTLAPLGGAPTAFWSTLLPSAGSVDDYHQSNSISVLASACTV